MQIQFWILFFFFFLGQKFWIFFIYLYSFFYLFIFSQVLASQIQLENKYKATQQALVSFSHRLVYLLSLVFGQQFLNLYDNRYRRAQLALGKGDEDLAREAHLSVYIVYIRPYIYLCTITKQHFSYRHLVRSCLQQIFI